MTMYKESIEIRKTPEIDSRYNCLPEDKRQIVDFLLDYCFLDDKGVYTNGTVLIPMFRVLDGLILDGKPYRAVCT